MLQMAEIAPNSCFIRSYSSQNVSETKKSNFRTRMDRLPSCVTNPTRIHNVLYFIKRVNRDLMVITSLLIIHTSRRFVFDDNIRHTSTLTLGEAPIWCSSSISIRLRVDFEEKYNNRKHFASDHSDNQTSNSPHFQESCF